MATSTVIKPLLLWWHRCILRASIASRTGARRRFVGGSRLGEPQLFMQRHIEKMMYDTARWMLSEYGIFEN